LPNRIYALIEAKPGSGLYRSEDAGATWALVNGAANLITRPFYYTTLGVDPNDANLVFVGNEGWYKSTDGGKSFRPSPAPHGDHHDLWINPKNSQVMIQSNDGGANVSLDGGRNWSTQLNQPTAEIYQVAVDDQYPYRVYGAQQDNTTVIVPSLPLGNGQDFRDGPGCETGPIIPDVKRPDLVYGSCKGQFTRLNLNTSNEERYWIGVQSLYGNPGGDLIYRFQRVSPMEVSPHDSRIVYYGSQFVHRTRDGGITWEKISPDLTARPEGTQGASGEPITRDATGEEVYSTLYSIRESPLQKGVIWAGSNDLFDATTASELPAAKQAAKQVATIPGYGALGSTCLAHTLTRLPYANSDAVIAQTGLDPRPDDSGQKHGRRRLSKRGPGEQRRILFNCARAATRTRHWQPYYAAQLAKGLSSTAATVILARKMVRVAFAVVKQNQPFDPERVGVNA